MTKPKLPHERKKIGRPKKIPVSPSFTESAEAPDPATPEPAIIEPIQPPLPEPPKPRSNIWSYETPLDALSDGATLDPRVIEINGMKFQKRSDCVYKFCPYKIIDRVLKSKAMTREEREENPGENELNIYRHIIRADLWFFVYFVMKNPLANHPFIIQACKEIQDEKGDSLEVWARDHLKTTVISAGRQAQKILNDPERRIGLFSATRPLALKIQNLIRNIFESNFLISCFPDILYADPYKEAEKWSESPEGGLVVKRKGFYKEPTVSSWGLIEGMPIGDHYTDMVFDDIVTQDLQSPEIIQKVCDNFDMAENIGTRDCQITVIGTFYRHDDPLVYISNKTDPATGLKMFKMRKKTATIDGTFNGRSVFLPEKSLAKKRAGNLYFFFCQQLLDPTPRGQEKLNRDHLVRVSKKQLPENLYRFMLIDGAGDRGRRSDNRSADAWAMMVIGVEPSRDELGLSRIYILDLKIREMDLITAQEMAVEMYCRNGRILRLGIEKVGMSTTEIHICTALRAKRRFVSLEAGNLEILKTAGRSKQYRIESALSWPLKNGKIHILDTVEVQDSERLGLEMEKFPAWHDDGLDGLSYVYDMIKGYRFGAQRSESKKEDPYDAAFRRAREGGKGKGWIAV